MARITSQEIRRIVATTVLFLGIGFVIFPVRAWFAAAVSSSPQMQMLAGIGIITVGAYFFNY